MNQAVWKLTALAGIVGLGLLVVMQKDGLDRLQLSQLSIEDPNATGSKGSERTASTDDRQPSIGGPESFTDDPVSADAKLRGEPTSPASRSSGLSDLLGLEQAEPPSEPAPRRTVPVPVADEIGVPIVSADNPRNPPPAGRDIPRGDPLLDVEPLVERPRVAPRGEDVALDLPPANEVSPAPTETTTPIPVNEPEPTPRPFTRGEPRPALDIPAIDPEGESFVNERPAPAVAPVEPAPIDPAIVPLEPVPATPRTPDSLPVTPPANESLPIPQELADETMSLPSDRPTAPTLKDEAQRQPAITIQEDEDSIRMPANARSVPSLRRDPPPAAPAVPFESIDPVPTTPIEPVPASDPVIDRTPIIERSAPPVAAANPEPISPRVATTQASPRPQTDPDDNADFANREPAASAAIPAAPTRLSPGPDPVSPQPLADTSVQPEPVPVSVTIDIPRSGGATISLPFDPSRFQEREADASAVRGIIPRTIISPPTTIASRDAIAPTAVPLTPSTRLANARPQLTLEKSAPESAIIGRPIVYTIVVRNDGQIAANQVTVDDVIPEGVRVDGTNPAAESNGKSLYWRLGTLRAGEERQLSVRVTPLRQGTIGSVARVSFAAEVTASTSVVEAPKPVLNFELTAPPRASLGGVVPFTFKVTNSGGSDATRVMVRNTLPRGLRHSSGGELEYEMGVVPAGQSRVVQLDLVAAMPGAVINRAVVSADGGIQTAAVATVEVQGLQLALDRLGPKRVYVGRNGTFTNTLTNSGDLSLRNLTLVETLPAGLEFVSASGGGRYDQRSRQVTWRIDSIDPKQVVQAQVVLQSTGRGPQISQVRVVDANGYSVDATHSMDSGGVAALSILRSELASPIGLGEEIRFKTQIYNRGSEPATKVSLTLVSPRGYQIVSARGPTEFNSVEGGIRFEPVARIDAGKQFEFEVVLKGANPGESRIQMQVEADQLEQPLRSEEAGTVFDAAR